MVVPARPSDVFRLPDDPPPPPPPPAPPPRRSGVPAWVGVVVLVAVGTVLAVVGSTGGDGDPVAPAVDVVTEDHAISALTLYGEEHAAVSRLQERREIYRDGGPTGAVQRARTAEQQITRALRQAQRQIGAPAVATAYWNDGSHAAFLRDVAAVRNFGERISLLDTTHDTLYSGTGEILPGEAYDRIVSNFGGRPRQSGRDAADRWAATLLDELEGRRSLPAAVAAREETAQAWRAAVDALAVPAEQQLAAYIGALPQGTVTALKGHPVAGPALRTLEGSPAWQRP